MAEAARILGASRCAVLGGMATDAAGAAAAVALARRIGGVIDHAHSGPLLRDLEVMRTAGWMVATPPQARARADLALLVGAGWRPGRAAGGGTRRCRRASRIGAAGDPARAGAGCGDRGCRNDRGKSGRVARPAWRPARGRGRPAGAAAGGAAAGVVRRRRGAQVRALRRGVVVGGHARRARDRDAVRPDRRPQRAHPVCRSAGGACRQRGRRRADLRLAHRLSCPGRVRARRGGARPVAVRRGAHDRGRARRTRRCGSTRSAVRHRRPGT